MTETVKEPDVEFDVDAMLSSLVSVRSEVPEDALTAPVLGTERMGNGVVIGDRGLVLTIGYLVTEAQTLWITDHRGLAVPGHVLGYDQESGFGLVQALQPLTAPAMDLGVSAACDVGDPIVVAGHAAATRSSPDASSRSASSPGTGSTCSTKPCSPHRHTRTGGAPRSSAPTAGCSASAPFSYRPSRRAVRRGARTWSFRSTC